MRLPGSRAWGGGPSCTAPSPECRMQRDASREPGDSGGDVSRGRVSTWSAGTRVSETAPDASSARPTRQGHGFNKAPRAQRQDTRCGDSRAPRELCERRRSAVPLLTPVPLDVRQQLLLPPRGAGMLRRDDTHTRVFACTPRGARTQCPFPSSPRAGSQRRKPVPTARDCPRDLHPR